MPNEVGVAVCQAAGLPAAGPGQNEKGTAGVGGGFALLRIEVVEEGQVGGDRSPPKESTRGNGPSFDDPLSIPPVAAGGAPLPPPRSSSPLPTRAECAASLPL